MIDSSSRIEQLRRQLKVALPGWNDIDPLCDFARRGLEAQRVDRVSGAGRLTYDRATKTVKDSNGRVVLAGPIEEGCVF